MLIELSGLLSLYDLWRRYTLAVATEKNARSSSLMARACPVTVNVALDRRSLEPGSHVAARVTMHTQSTALAVWTNPASEALKWAVTDS